MSYSKKGCNLIKGLVLRLGYLAICKDPEECKEHAKWEESVILQRGLHGGKTNAHKEIGTPIDEDGHAHGGRPRALGEKFRRDHPGYGTRTDGEKDHVEQCGDHGEPPNPGHELLES